MARHSSSEDRDYTTADRVAKYKTIRPLLEAIFEEFKELSKKKPEVTLNKQKVALVNRLLRDALTILEDEPTKPYLDLLDDEVLPQNSGFVLILSQFDTAMAAFYTRYWDSNFITGQGWNTR